MRWLFRSLISAFWYLMIGIAILWINYTSVEIQADLIRSALVVVFWPFCLLWWGFVWFLIIVGVIFGGFVIYFIATDGWERYEQAKRVRKIRARLGMK